DLRSAERAAGPRTPPRRTRPEAASPRETALWERPATTGRRTRSCCRRRRPRTAQSRAHRTASLLRARRTTASAAKRSRRALAKREADATHGLDQVGRAGLGELLSQTFEVRIHRALGERVVVAPHPCDQLLARAHAPRRLREHGKQVEFDLGERELRAMP